MSHYRRSHTPGATYFFTVVSYRRQPILCDEPLRQALRSAIETVCQRRPFTIDAWVLLPDHLHCIWTLPPADGDFLHTLGCQTANEPRLHSRLSQRIPAHHLKTQPSRIDPVAAALFGSTKFAVMPILQRHIDYIHFNPVKHGLCVRVADWPFSTFHRCVTQGVYPSNWAGSSDVIVTVGE